ncbi:large subunit ribosomal protein L13Ae [Anopheles darlingi]|uniref:Large subunit ribosomal protein L13Ae n=1 Tax=Anopheles darlingi TaxID=43151 RepID=W5JTW8_ANODA|nr:large subunit ribosomal protein L13Ae [Anopheles darlingi]
MVPHKTKRGQNALRHLKVYEGIPPPFDRQKRLVVPIALRQLCLRPDRKYCSVDRVAHEVGWKYRDVVNNLEAKRKIKARLSYLHKKKLKKITWKARVAVADSIKPQNEVLKQYGYLTSEFEKKYTRTASSATSTKLGKRERQDLYLAAKAERKASRLEAKKLGKVVKRKSKAKAKAKPTGKSARGVRGGDDHDDLAMGTTPISILHREMAQFRTADALSAKKLQRILKRNTDRKMATPLLAIVRECGPECSLPTHQLPQEGNAVDGNPSLAPDCLLEVAAFTKEHYKNVKAGIWRDLVLEAIVI